MINGGFIQFNEIRFRKIEKVERRKYIRKEIDKDERESRQLKKR